MHICMYALVQSKVHDGRQAGLVTRVHEAESERKSKHAVCV